MPTRPPLRVAALLLCLLLTTGCARIAGEPFQPTHNAALPLERGAALGQTFQVPSGAVAGVDLLTATYGRTPAADAELIVRLRQDADGPVLAEVALAGTAVPDNGWAIATFEDGPVPVADGVAAVEVTWDGAEPVALRANVPPGDWTADLLLNDPYPGGELLRDGSRGTGDLAFRVRGAPGAGDGARAVGRLGLGAARGLLDRPLFAVAWSALLAGCLALAVVGLRRGGRRGGGLRRRGREQDLP
jgi:hypothetical protein